MNGETRSFETDRPSVLSLNLVVDGGFSLVDRELTEGARQDSSHRHPRN